MPRRGRRAARHAGLDLVGRRGAERQDHEQHQPPDHHEHDAGANQLIARSGLLELDQRAAEVLGVQEQDRPIVGAELGLAVAQHPGAGGEQAIARGEDVRRPRSRGDGCRRPDGARGRPRSASPRPSGCSSSILVLGSSTNTVVTPCAGCAARRRDPGAQQIAILRRGGGEIRHHDRDVVEAPDHQTAPASSSSPSSASRPRRVICTSMIGRRSRTSRKARRTAARTAVADLLVVERGRVVELLDRILDRVLHASP